MKPFLLNVSLVVASLACAALPSRYIADTDQSELTLTPLSGDTRDIVSFSAMSASEAGLVAFIGREDPENPSSDGLRDPHGGLSSLWVWQNDTLTKVVDAYAFFRAAGESEDRIMEQPESVVAVDGDWVIFVEGREFGADRAWTYRLSTAEIRPLMEVDSPVPGASGGVFSSFGSVLKSEAGVAVISASFEVEDVVEQGFFRFENGALTLIYRPGESGFAGYISFFNITTSGRVAFMQTLREENRYQIERLVEGQLGSETIVLEEGDMVGDCLIPANAGPFFPTIIGVVYNKSGHWALDLANDNATGLVVRDGSGLRCALAPPLEVEIANFGTASGVTNPVIADDDTLFWRAGDTNADGTFPPGSGKEGQPFYAADMLVIDRAGERFAVYYPGADSDDPVLRGPGFEGDVSLLPSRPVGSPATIGDAFLVTPARTFSSTAENPDLDPQPIRSVHVVLPTLEIERLFAAGDIITNPVSQRGFEIVEQANVIVRTGRFVPRVFDVVAVDDTEQAEQSLVVYDVGVDPSVAPSFSARIVRGEGAGAFSVVFSTKADRRYQIEAYDPATGWQAHGSEIVGTGGQLSQPLGPLANRILFRVEETASE